MRRSLFGRGTALNRGQKHAKETEQEREARKAAVERHRREVSELKRFWNLLLRGMEVKTWKTDESVLKEADENDIDGIPSDVLALGNSILTMMDTSTESKRTATEKNKPEHQDADYTTKDLEAEEEYSVLWLLSSEPVICVDEQKSSCEAHRSPQCSLFPLAQLQDPVPVHVQDSRFFGILLCTNSSDRLVVGLPTERCRSLMLEHLARVMAAFAALGSRDAKRRDLSFSANMEIALFACNPMKHNNKFHESPSEQEPEQEPTIDLASKSDVFISCGVESTAGSQLYVREQAKREVSLLLRKYGQQGPYQSNNCRSN